MSEIKTNTKRVPNIPNVKNKTATKPMAPKSPIKVKMPVMRKAGRGR
jgi:hypothetical protein